MKLKCGCLEAKEGRSDSRRLINLSLKAFIVTVVIYQLDGGYIEGVSQTRD
jgi:hypothetical protein